MNIVKLDAIESTNSFLKEMAVKSEIPNFTVVLTDKQTLGRGQVNTKWISESGKNLLCSIFLRANKLYVLNQVYLNFAIALAIYESLSEFNLPDLEIKWPNDILSAKKKICGILIENILKGDMIHATIIGIGINVNQERFSKDLSNASSMKNILNKEIMIQKILSVIIQKLKLKIRVLDTKEYQELEKQYNSVLHKKNVPGIFKSKENEFFIGKVLGVNTKNGKLRVELDSQTIKEFGLKELSFTHLT